jgi:hypothetical protein
VQHAIAEFYDTCSSNTRCPAFCRGLQLSSREARLECPPSSCGRAVRQTEASEKGLKENRKFGNEICLQNVFAHLDLSDVVDSVVRQIQSEKPR